VTFNTRDFCALHKDWLGSPDESVTATLKSIADLPRLKRIALEAPHAASWHELMETP